MMALRSGNLFAAVKFELDDATSSTSPQYSNPLPRLSVSKPSWIVKTESNVWKEEVKKPNPPCVVCGGTGRVDCYNCKGKGRTNCVDLAMLPKGEWPKWCKACGGSGLGHCSRCLGTGEYRDKMGFYFMKLDKAADSSRRNQNRTPN